MLIPMPAVPMQAGPPSAYARSMAPYLVAVLVLQSVMCICRMVLFLDIMGGFIMAICIGIGWYAYKDDMNITFTSYWGMMCLFNGAFDLVKFIDSAVKSPFPIFSRQMPSSYNLVSFIALMIPISVLLGAPIGWRLYKHYTEGDIQEHSYLQGGGPNGANNSARAYDRSPSPMSYGADRPSRIFAGQGQRLGGP
mmetsp:Transcript_34916/g.52552  ORF Transcript_34916/g.52552 Transcript_34916/m.52552 type:complete len:194 (+) Transcript_34916:78-659(+)|eukprot:CAMPEP_0194764482 /NCGR_PEP_ID=MMETSP0323_2-20130528/22982_1 /TAXON_ID=2866 ORGANISM="Crypthecodinium cohnii, Strain Seligo" /NCGR_SAMPLE_ID=MMETSP0323_2 /ASSEMBLY_ACC=CAM_ASM_000346 /LENGTH=193 /DNA_ID=CAMNT_0039691723 /DNA_START=59 /DNA_END=640 /DNA_ORIENTATION=-